MTEEQIRELIREEARKLIKEELTLECESASDFYSSGIRVSVKLGREVVTSDTFTFPSDSKPW